MSRHHNAKRAPLPVSRPIQSAGPALEAMMMALADWIFVNCSEAERLGFWRVELNHPAGEAMQTGTWRFFKRVLGPLQPGDAERARAVAARVPAALRARLSALLSGKEP